MNNENWFDPVNEEEPVITICDGSVTHWTKRKHAKAFFHEKYLNSPMETREKYGSVLVNILLGKEIACDESGYKNVIVYFDMDGVLAKFQKEVPAEATKVPGYCLGLDEDPKAIMLANMLRIRGIAVCALSAVWHDKAKSDKREWLDKKIGKDFPAIFVPNGADKSQYIKQGRRSILIDDFSRNLHEWTRAGHIGIKYMNGINGNNGTWKGLRLDEDMSSVQMLGYVMAHINM